MDSFVNRHFISPGQVRYQNLWLELELSTELGGKYRWGGWRAPSKPSKKRTRRAFCHGGIPRRGRVAYNSAAVIEGESYYSDEPIRDDSIEYGESIMDTSDQDSGLGNHLRRGDRNPN